MNLTILIAITLATLSFSADAELVRPGMLNNSQSRIILSKYLSNETNTSIGRDNLIRLTGNLERSKENVSTLMVALSKNVSSEEKSLLLRLLGDMRDVSNPHGLNTDIIKELKLQMESANNEIASAALYAYTRSGYDKDYLSVVRRMRSRKIINDDTYYGEHAHLLNFAPLQDQQVMLNEIANSRNSYALMVLTSEAPSRSLTPAIRKQLLTTLQANEPTFSKAIGELTSSYEYEGWLNTVVALMAGDSQVERRQAVLRMLSQPELDPRKILVYMSGPYGRKLVQETNDLRQLDSLNNKLCRYANSFPTTPNIQELALAAQLYLREAHREFKAVSCERYRH